MVSPVGVGPHGSKPPNAALWGAGGLTVVVGGRCGGSAVSLSLPNLMRVGAVLVAEDGWSSRPAPVLPKTPAPLLPVTRG